MVTVPSKAIGKGKCKYCRDSFSIYSKYKRKIFCSPSCALIYNNKLRSNSIKINCDFCGKEYLEYPCRMKYKHKFCSMECKGLWMKQDKEFISNLISNGFRKGNKPSWNYRTSKENFLGFSNDYWRKKARKIMGLEKGNELIVHHIDEDITNNKPENLYIMARPEHTTYHNLERYKR